MRLFIILHDDENTSHRETNFDYTEEVWPISCILIERSLHLDYDKSTRKTHPTGVSYLAHSSIDLPQQSAVICSPG